MRSTPALLFLVLLAACEPDSDSAALADAGDDVGGGEGGGEAGGLEGDVILRNRVALDMPVMLRPLADDVTLDCAAVEDDPTASLPDSVFAPGREVVLSPHQMQVVWPHEPAERPCYAVRVESEGLGARVLFWPDGEPPILRYPETCCDVGEGVVELIPVNGGQSLDLLGNTWLVHPVAD